MLNINTVLKSLKLKADKAELVVIKQDIQQMNNRISTLEVGTWKSVISVPPFSLLVTVCVYHG